LKSIVVEYRNKIEHEKDERRAKTNEYWEKRRTEVKTEKTNEGDNADEHEMKNV
jgi:hypothetical protein